MSDSEDYRKAFDGEFVNQNAILIRAFQAAVETRRFEIDLYWKRAGYFWALIAVALAGYFTVQSVNVSDRRFFSFVIACAGFFFTLAWFFVNKGSKFWQENWENHVALLGRRIVGPLYEWVLHRKEWRIGDVVGPARISVSRINQWVSCYLMLIWLYLMSLAAQPSHLSCIACLQRHPYAIVFLATLIMAVIMRAGSRTNLRRHSPNLTRMRTEIGD